MTDVVDDEIEPRPLRVGLLVGVPLLVVLLAFIAVLATSEPSTDRRSSTALRGQIAPVIEGTTLDGDEFTMASTRGDFVLVNFFATWCTPCVREHPELVEFEQRHARTGDALVVSVLYDDSIDGAREFFADFGGDWPVVVDPTGRYALDYGVVRVPESYFVDPNGIVVEKLIGGVTADGLDAILRRLQGGA